MAAVVQGTAHIFGIGATITNMTITGITNEHGFEMNETVENSDGVTIETRRDNRKKSLTVTGKIQSGYAQPTLGAKVTIAGLDAAYNGDYEIVKNGATYNAGAHVECSFDAEKYESVAVA
jgi:hypothetical protein